MQASLQASSLLPEDESTNVRYYETSPLLTDAQYEAQAAEVAALWEAYYDHIRGFLSKLLTGVGEIKFYNLDDPSPRFPFWIETINFAPVATTDTAPAEVAVVSSFQAVPVAGTPQARRRGRNFLGPIAANSIVGATGLVSPAFTGFIKVAEQTFRNGFATLTDPADWVVVHAANSASPVASVVDNGWIENAPDTQRRRGRGSTLRDAWL